MNLFGRARMAIQKKRRRYSPTDCLIETLEEFGEREPQEVLVVFTQGDDIALRSNARTVTALGLSLAAKRMPEKAVGQ